MSHSAPHHKCCHTDPVLSRVVELYRELIAHDGFGELRIDVRILKRRQKEVIVTCGKQYRYVVDMPESALEDGATPEIERLQGDAPEVPVRVET